MINFKSLFLGILILTLGITTFGQINKFDIGIEGCPSLTSLRGYGYSNENHSPAISFSGGLFIQYNFRNSISFLSSIAFERKSSVSTTTLTDENGWVIGEGTIHRNFDYLILPILIRATFGKKVLYFVNGGLFGGYLIKQTYSIKGGGFTSSTIDVTPEDRRFDMGISTGLGLSVPLKSKYAISFEIRNNLGLSNVSALGTFKTNSTNFFFSFTRKLGK